MAFEVERQAGFNLALGNRLDAGANDLRGVSAQVDDHGGQCGGVGRPAQAERRQCKKEKEQLHQKRRVADQLDVDIDEKAQRFRPGSFAPGANDGHQQAEQHGQQRQLDGVPGALEEQRPGGEDVTELECVVHERGAAVAMAAIAWIAAVCSSISGDMVGRCFWIILKPVSLNYRRNRTLLVTRGKP